MTSPIASCALMLAWALFCVPGPTAAANLEAEGVANIKPVGLERARQMAIEDAKEQVAMRAGVDIESTNIVGPRGVPLESSRIRKSALGDITIVREWQSDEQVHVRISANVDMSGAGLSASHKYKKKLAAVPFVVRKSTVSDDIDDIGKGFAGELMRRLDDSNKFLTKRSTYTLPPNAAGPSEDREAIVHLATMYDSQFLIAGEIIDAGTGEVGGVLGWFKHTQRRFEAQVFVYDGSTGTLIARHRVEQSAIGDIAVGRDKVFAGTSFMATNYGKAISAAIDASAALIVHDLENIPFTARVIRIADDKLVIDAGGTSLIAPGDKLVAYRLHKELPVMSYGSDAQFGITESPVATVSIVQVQPQFSICALPANSKAGQMEIGDLVRFDVVNRQPEPRPARMY
jgi:hypothetical protein